MFIFLWSISSYHYLIIDNGVVVTTTVQRHSTKSELRFCAGSNPASDMSEICYGEDLWLWSRLKIKPNAFCRSVITQKQFIIIKHLIASDCDDFLFEKIVRVFLFPLLPLKAEISFPFFPGSGVGKKLSIIEVTATGLEPRTT